MPIRARMVTDRTKPLAGITTHVPRATHDAFEQIAEGRGKTKATLLRELIEEFVARASAPSDRSVA